MKKYFFLALLFTFYSLTVRSQDNKHEIGVNLFKYNNLLADGISPDYRFQFLIFEHNGLNSYHNYFITYVTPQIFYTLKFYRNFSYRSEIQFMRTNSNYHRHGVKVNPIEYVYLGARTNKSSKLYLGNGIQYTFLPTKKIRPYLFGIGTLNAIFSRSIDYDQLGSLERYRIHKSEILYGYNLGIGVQYQFCKRFSTNLELSENSSFESHLISRLSINYHF